MCLLPFVPPLLQIPPRNSSWRHVDRLDEPGDSKSLQVGRGWPPWSSNAHSGLDVSNRTCLHATLLALCHLPSPLLCP